jgi:hypothetical protein
MKDFHEMFYDYHATKDQKPFLLFNSLPLVMRYTVVQLFAALCYKLEGRGFDSQWGL